MECHKNKSIITSTLALCSVTNIHVFDWKKVVIDQKNDHIKVYVLAYCVIHLSCLVENMITLIILNSTL